MKKKISIIIPMIHEFPQIYGTVNHLQTEMLDSSYKWEIVVAENGTADENTPRAFTGQRPLYRAIMHNKLLKYVFEPRQCGPVARNTGAKEADGDFVVFMDAHTSPGKNTIDILADYLTDHEECGGVAGLTSWSHYDFSRMGAYYELFHAKEKLEKLEGGPTLPTHMHGHYMAVGHLKGKNIEAYKTIMKKKPITVVMGSQAYTMYRRDEFLKLGGYYDECRFYPHPEGYMPLKVWMTGKTMVTHPESWHIHGMYPMSYKQTNQHKMLSRINSVLEWEMEDSEKLEWIKGALQYNQPDEAMRKIKEYGNWSWSEHGVRNVFMIAYILGDLKWLDICYKYLIKKHGKRRLPELRESAIETVDKSGMRVKLRDMQIMSMDEVLIKARKEKIPGMEFWFEPIGKDPLE